jgi:ferric-dicitrate binding protein FerR (iron transport regulator)
MNEEQMNDRSDEAEVAALLRAAGPRPMISSAAMAEARAAVAAEWRSVVAARERRRRYTVWSAAAGIAVAGIAVWLARPVLDAPPETIAAVVRVEGGLQQSQGDGAWVTVAANGAVGAGAQLRTAGDGRAALRMANGLELRLDSDTRIAFEDSGRARLAQGAVFVDSGAAAGAPAADFELETPAGSVRHLGTQYFARVDGARLQVGVREGRVALDGPAGSAIGGAGEQLTVADGRVSRAPLPRTAADWQWIAGVTPPFSIEGRSVEEFLAWAARETGRTIVYTTPEAGRQARSVTLSGSVEGLAPDAAVTAVLSTTSLRPEIGAEQIRVGAASD